MLEKKGPLDELTLDDMIDVYMIVLTRFDTKSGCFIPKFIEEKGIFESFEKAMQCISNELDNKPRHWYSIAPLMIPKGLDSRELLHCINFDTMVKEKFFEEAKKEQEKVETNQGKAMIIPIEEVWEQHGGIPENSKGNELR